MSVNLPFENPTLPNLLESVDHVLVEFAHRAQTTITLPQLTPSLMEAMLFIEPAVYTLLAARRGIAGLIEEDPALKEGRSLFIDLALALVAVVRLNSKVEHLTSTQEQVIKPEYSTVEELVQAAQSDDLENQIIRLLTHRTSKNC